MFSAEQIREYREAFPGDETIEATFQRLRREGHSRLEAVRVILEVLDVSLSEAKTLLLTCETWEEASAAAEASSGADEHDPYDDPVRPAPAD